MDTFNIPPPQFPPDTSPSPETRKEMIDHTPAKRNILIYERHIESLMEQVNNKDKELMEFRSRLLSDAQYRSKFTCIRKGKIETVIQLILVTVISSAGGLLMGIYPKINDTFPPQFVVGATLVAIGIVLGIVVRPISLVVCYVWPRFCKDD